MWKKVLLILNLLVLFSLIIVIYQQHEKIHDYRSFLYSQLAVINVPIERILIYHEQGKYNEDINQEVFTTLEENYADIFNHTGTGLQYEADIKEKYFTYYNDIKVEYVHLIAEYKTAKTNVERDNVYSRIRSNYENYNSYIEMARKNLLNE